MGAIAFLRPTMEAEFKPPRRQIATDLKNFRSIASNDFDGNTVAMDRGRELKRMTGIEIADLFGYRQITLFQSQSSAGNQWLCEQKPSDAHFVFSLTSLRCTENGSVDIFFFDVRESNQSACNFFHDGRLVLHIAYAIDVTYSRQEKYSTFSRHLPAPSRLKSSVFCQDLLPGIEQLGPGERPAGSG